MRETDVVVIGGGTAGMAAYSVSKRKTRNVLVINDGPWGTICARVGCMPSKAILQIADEYHKTLKLQKDGIIDLKDYSLNGKGVMKAIRSKRDYLVNHVLSQTEKFGDDRISGRAKFLDANTIEVDGEKIKANSFVIATGSSPVLPKAWKELSDKVITSDQVFELDELPKSVAVIGLGPLGLELGQSLGRLGVEIHGFGLAEMGIGGIQDPEILTMAMDHIGQDFPMTLGAPAEVTKGSGELLKVTSGEVSVEVEYVLVAMGRRPNIDGLGLENIGVELDKRGMPPYNPETTRIPGTNIFMAGDSNGERAIWHEAIDEGRIAGANVMSEKDTAFLRKSSMGIGFTDPNIGFIGKRYNELNREEIAIGEARFGKGGRTYVMDTPGVLRVYGDKKTAKILGAEMIAPKGENLVHQLAMAIENGLTGMDLIKAPYYHPTVEEGLHMALKKMVRNSDVGKYQEVVPK